MTKKNYIAIAKKLNLLSKFINAGGMSGELPARVFESAVERISEAFQEDNIKFQRHKFLEAVFQESQIK